MELGMCMMDCIPAVLLTVIVCVLVQRYMFGRRPDRPPGPGWNLPIVGHLLQVEPDMRTMLRRFRRKYGDVYSLYFGNKFTVIIAGYDAIKEAFLTNGEHFAERPTDMFILDEITKKMGIVHASGELWDTHRRFALRTLKDFGLGRSILESKIQDEVNLLIKTFEKNTGTPFAPLETVSVSVSNITCSIVFGGHFKHGDPRFVKMVKAMDENFSNIGLAGMVQFIPLLRAIPGDMFRLKKVFKNAAMVFEFMEEIIQEHVETYDENVIEDYTSAYIKEMRNRTDEPSFNLKQLEKIIGDLFVAGTETTSTALTWTLLYLVNYPDLQERMFAEINEHVGTGRQPSMSDKANLAFTEAFLMEILRHAQNGFTSLGHAVLDSVSFRGYTISPDDLILADLDSVMHDTDIWGDPENFRPDRFLDADGHVQQPTKYIPFFIGKRSCIGKSMAKMELLLFTASIVQQFKISAPAGEDVSLATVDGIFGLTHKPKPYRIVLTLRNE